MNRHPGREEQTIHLLKSIELKKGMKALDLGAGEGETVRIMKAFGLNVQGVDLVPRSSEVQQGDFLDLQYAADSMDLCISQCAFFVSRDQKKAVSECWRVLKKGGFLLLADLDPGNLLEIVKETGFTILCQEDQTALWREYYLEAIWNDSFCCEDHKLLQKEYKGRKIGYTMVRKNNGIRQHGISLFTDHYDHDSGNHRRGKSTACKGNGRPWRRNRLLWRYLRMSDRKCLCHRIFSRKSGS